jgi:hypothetical protein
MPEQLEICFTVSMWNRMEHFERLLENLSLIYREDQDIVLSVGAFVDKPEERSRIFALISRFPFRTPVVFLEGEFCNGLGHNEAAKRSSLGCILCPITVDLRMPMDITQRIRENVEPSKKFYGPKVYNESSDGRIHLCEYAYSLIAMHRYDFDRTGGFAENMKWGGDHHEGGEDKVLTQKLRDLGLEEVRPICNDLVCRWHPRDVTQTYYTSLGRYHKKPWWDFVDEKGEPVEKA